MTQTELFIRNYDINTKTSSFKKVDSEKYDTISAQEIMTLIKLVNENADMLHKKYDKYDFSALFENENDDIAETDNKVDKKTAKQELIEKNYDIIKYDTIKSDTAESDKILVEYPFSAHTYNTLNFRNLDFLFDEKNHFIAKFSAREMKIYRTMFKYREFYGETEFLKFYNEDCSKNIFAFSLSTDYEKLTLELNVFIFEHYADFELSISDEIYVKKETFVFDVKSGQTLISKSCIHNVYQLKAIEDSKEKCFDSPLIPLEKVLEFLHDTSLKVFFKNDDFPYQSQLYPSKLFDECFKIIFELSCLFTGLTLSIKKSKYDDILEQLVQITAIPYEYKIYPVLRHKSIGEKFSYSRTDSEIYNNFCKRFKIRNSPSIRKLYEENPESLLVFKSIYECGFKNIDIIMQLASNENAKEIFVPYRNENTTALKFVCKKLIKKYSEKKASSIILKNFSGNYIFHDGVRMFKRYYKFVPADLKKKILKEGFSEYVHNALSNIAYQHENDKVVFKYSSEQRSLEDEIGDYEFFLPKDSYQLCEIANALHNCVASYVDSIIDNTCTIVAAKKNEKITLCIEVQEKLIWQQRTIYNADPIEADAEALKIWREKHNLEFIGNRY
mgnify:CR=1 FL=1